MPQDENIHSLDSFVDSFSEVIRDRSRVGNVNVPCTGAAQGLARLTDLCALQFQKQAFIDPREIRAFAECVDMLLNHCVAPSTLLLERLKGQAAEAQRKDGKSYRINPRYRTESIPLSVHNPLDLEFVMDPFYSMMSHYIAEAQIAHMSPTQLYTWIYFMIAHEIQPWVYSNSIHASILVMLVARILRLPTLHSGEEHEKHSM